MGERRSDAVGGLLFVSILLFLLASLISHVAGDDLAAIWAAVMALVFVEIVR